MCLSSIAVLKCLFFLFQGGLLQEMYTLQNEESITAKKEPEVTFTFKCSMCEIGFRSKKDCEIHCEQHLETGLVFKCTICKEATFADKGRLNEHYDSVHQGNILFGRNVGWILQCITCLNVFSSKPKIMDHIGSVHGFAKVITIENQCSDPEKSEIPEKSEDFDETLNSNDDLEGNSNKHHNQSVKNYTIQKYKPDRFFKPQKNLDEHNNTHHNQENKNKQAGLTKWQNFAKCLLCGATDPHSHRPGVFRNRLEALEIVKGQLILKCPFGVFKSP